ncbi:recombination mediator RecR [Candidatus Uabimicrobium amorphum]|uniref:Recombination protein RecR n=1 Tax=Uabimicrobium amorphum TaxID=2596890 RepID=A0A5S9IPT2_UABAM|nr:recombination mediator RecR [Candidatus Uabimicrobium amorphum]BBM85858.1 recombination protein RecR [Candidatus Uabimicrobium amorphum]
MAYTRSLKNLIAEFGKLPGIGNKTAERLGFYILNVSHGEAMNLADAIAEVKNNVKRCKMCFNIADEELCDICSNPRRDHSTICVVEQTKDLISLEKTATYQGLYHVLMGRLAPLENQHLETTTIKELIERSKNEEVKEIILATNPNIEGDATALYIREQLESFPVKISKIARGIPTGGSIEFANQAMLSDALSGRQDFK